MARAAGAAKTVLASVELLYEGGASQNLEGKHVIRVFELIGLEGFTEDQGTYFLMVGTVLRLLLRHANADPKEMFAKTMADLEELDRDIDEKHFNEIVEQFKHGGLGDEPSAL